jgi:WD40 repeat protein
MVACEKGENKDFKFDEIPGQQQPSKTPDNIYDSERAIIMVDQWQDRIVIADQPSGGVMWEWKASDSRQILENHRSWFNTPDEVKPVYGRRYFIMSASGGGIAIVRISDKKVMFYANPGGNPHSVEILPDGNLVAASSAGNTLKLYSVDTVAGYASTPKQTLYLGDGHNVVWDKANNCLWATNATNGAVNAYSYDRTSTSLSSKLSCPLPENVTSPHDMFPVYGSDRLLWLSVAQSIQTFDVISQKFTMEYNQSNIKSVSSGPAGFPVIALKPVTEWWTERITSASGGVLFEKADYKIYKARWFLDNAFSYPENDTFRQP